MLSAPQIAKPEAVAAERPSCFHCGAPCPDASLAVGDHLFCCAGCRTVFEILDSNGLQRFYSLDAMPGVRPEADARQERFAFLNDEQVKRQMLDFSDGTNARVTFHVPAIHCIACVWLLENLFRMKPGIGRSEVNFPRREVSIQFSEKEISLSALAGLLASLGYEPTLNLASVEEPAADPESRRLLLKIGVAGFSFGNIMLLSFPSYLGLNPATEGVLQRFFGLISLLLALPVLVYSASDYWRGTWQCIRQRVITIEFPIALGIAALFLQSLWDIVGHRGEGYLDSFSGLVFLLLCGKWFQRKTYETLSFDRDYRSYFPLSILRKSAAGEAVVPVTSLNVGDRVIVRHQELIPADAVLIAGTGSVDYSFVTGESTPVTRQTGDYVYAGGRQQGAAIEVEIVKKVSQSYLTSLWNSEAFRKTDRPDINSMLNVAGRRFTYAILFISLGVAAFWAWRDPSRLVRAFSSVLLVACPCALALAAPFTLGSVLRVFGRHGFYLRNTSTVERLAQTTSVIFDKTGTLTSTREQDMLYQGLPLSDADRRALGSLARQSTHPLSRAVGRFLAGEAELSDFSELPGRGVQAAADGHLYQLGSKAWLKADGDETTAAYWAVDGEVRGRFVMKNAYRPSLGRVMQELGARFKVSIISGDDERERAFLQEYCGPGVKLSFRQSPFDKLERVRGAQSRGERVMMIGDGLNDAGALRQSDVGIAMTEDIASFAPACDAILDARMFGRLPEFTAFARTAMNILKASFGISLLYNFIAIGIASSGHLSPLVSAALMPASSFSVIGFSTVATRVVARWRGIR